MKSKYYTTSDGVEFYTENNAYNHARTLEDKTIIPPDVVVEDIEVDAEDSEREDVENEDKGNEFQEDEGDQNDAPIKINFGRMNKTQLIAYATEHQLTIDETGTNPAIVASIEAQLIEKTAE